MISLRRVEKHLRTSPISTISAVTILIIESATVGADARKVLTGLSTSLVLLVRYLVLGLTRRWYLDSLQRSMKELRKRVEMRRSSPRPNAKLITEMEKLYDELDLRYVYELASKE